MSLAHPLVDDHTDGSLSLQDLEDRVAFPPGEHVRIKQDPSIGAVLCGFDEYISTPYLAHSCTEDDVMTELLLRTDYKKYAKAHTYIMNNPGCEFIITNADATYPAGEGAFYPGASIYFSVMRHGGSDGASGNPFVATGAGSISAPLRYSTKKPPTIIGKPHKHMMDAIMAT